MPTYYKDAPLPRDKYIPWYFVAAFAFLFAVEAVLVTLAVTTQPGVVTDQSYERGIAYNRYLELQAEQEARGWQGHLQLHGSELAFTLLGRDGQKLTGATVDATATRPVGLEASTTATLKETQPGHYTARLDFPQPGQWKLGVTASWQGQLYQIQQTVFIRP